MEQILIGPHQVDIAGDILVVHWHGRPEGAPLHQVYKRIDQLVAEQGYALLLFDGQKAELANGEARRWVGQWAR